MSDDMARVVETHLVRAANLFQSERRKVTPDVISAWCRQFEECGLMPEQVQSGFLTTCLGDRHPVVGQVVKAASGVGEGCIDLRRACVYCTLTWTWSGLSPRVLKASTKAWIFDAARREVKAEELMKRRSQYAKNREAFLSEMRRIDPVPAIQHELPEAFR